MMKKVLITTCIILVALILYLFYNTNDDIMKKPSLNSKYDFILLDNSYKHDFRIILAEVNGKKVDRLQNYINEMLSELELSAPLSNTDFARYYNKYDQILSYEKYFNAHKQLAIRLLKEILQKSINSTLTEQDIKPFLTYLIFKKYSCYFKKQWFCLPYLKFSNEVYDNYFKNIDSFLSNDSNYENKINLYSEQFNVEDELCFNITKELNNKLLDQLKNSNLNTSSEFYSFYNLLMESKKDEYSLVYIIMD